MGSARRSPRWGATGSGALARLAARVRRLVRGTDPPRAGLPALPLVLRSDALAGPYLAAEREQDHRRAAAAAGRALEAAVRREAWWEADTWGQRALWHFEQAGSALQAVRMARRIGDLRSEAGDPASARRYYAEAISEARDIGAEREEGLGALGLGRAALDLGDVTTARRLAAIAVDLLVRCSAPGVEVAAARELRGAEKPVTKEAPL